MSRMADGRRVLVTGAGGFIGHHLVRRLKAQGAWVRGVDVKRPQFEDSPADDFLLLDLREFENCRTSVAGVDEVYQLAADMGGIGYITKVHASLTRNNVLINAHMLEASRLAAVQRYLYTSSACVYPSHLQEDEAVAPLREEDALPADPEKGYGWEKLFSEQLTAYYHEEYGLDTRVVRFHNIYGPLGSYEGGREKAPAAICRKVAEAEDGGTIKIWGDGNQTRSFCYIDDCVEGILRIGDSGYSDPLNLGTDELVTVDQLATTAAEVAGKKLRLVHELNQPQGVRGRNSDNTLLQKITGWQPGTLLQEGIRQTYQWVWHQLAVDNRAKPPAPASEILIARAAHA